MFELRQPESLIEQEATDVWLIHNGNSVSVEAQKGSNAPQTIVKIFHDGIVLPEIFCDTGVATDRKGRTKVKSEE